MSPLSHQNIKEQLQACRSKEDTFKALVTLSKTLPRLSAEDKTDDNQVKGCESAVWLFASQQSDCFTFYADSDAKLMRGLLAIVISIIQSQDKTTIRSIELMKELDDMNLSSYLTSSRTNGMNSIIKKIQSLVR